MSSKGKNMQKKKKRSSTKFDIGLNIPALGKGSASYQHVRAPIAKALKVRSVNPSINGGKTFIVKHSEYVADISGSTGFACTSYPINPGMAIAFPWLANIASAFEQWKCRKLQYRLETQAPTTSVGTIMLAIDYDPADAQPVDKQSFMATAGANRTAIWDSARCEALQSRRPFTNMFVRTGALAPNLDIKSYDLGVLNVATENSSSTTSLELYVDYEFEFITPEGTLSDPINAGSYNVVFSGSTRAAPFTTPGVATGGLPLTFSGGNTMTFGRAGTYLIILNYGGTACANNLSASFTTPSTNTDSRTTAATFVGSGVITGSTLAAGTVAVYIVIAYIYAPGDGITFNCTNLCTTMANCSVEIAPYNVNSATPSPILYKDITYGRPVTRKSVVFAGPSGVDDKGKEPEPEPLQILPALRPYSAMSLW